MQIQRRRFLILLAEANATKRNFFINWAMECRVKKKWRRTLLLRTFTPWADETRENNNMLRISQKLFRIALNRKRLSLPVTLAFFNPPAWLTDLTENEKIKIRRKVMIELFYSWEKEARMLKRNRFKASQALVR
jgi:hypothetical protein